VLGARGADYGRGQPDLARLVFASDGRIFTISADGSERVRLTGGSSVPASSGDGEPTWSPDRRTIAFVRSFRSPTEDAVSRILLMDSDGSNERPITKRGTAFQPRWSPDGRRLAYTRFSIGPTTLVSSIVIARRDGSHSRTLVKVRIDESSRALVSVGEPSWSADGRRLIYSRLALTWDGSFFPSLRLINADGSGGRLLARDAYSGAFSPSGDRIAFVSVRDRNGETCGSDECSSNGEIYVMDANGKNLRRLTRNEGDDQSPRWSADGLRLAFSSNRNYPTEFSGDELYSIGADGGCLTWLTNGTSESEGPDWEPDPAASSAPADCGAANRAPLIETDLSAARRATHRVFWLDDNFHNQLLTYVSPDFREGTLLSYDDCASFDPSDCLAEIELQEAPICRRKNIIVAEAGFGGRYLERRGALLADFGYEGGMAAYTGAVYVKLYAGEETAEPPASHTLPAELQVIAGLRRFGRERSETLPRAAFPRSLLRSLRQVRAAYSRLGSVRQVAEARGVRRATVRNKLRLERVLRRYGRVRPLPC
jgi:Tol biopolymer transport system component